MTDDAVHLSVEAPKRTHILGNEIFHPVLLAQLVYRIYLTAFHHSLNKLCFSHLHRHDVGQISVHNHA